MSNTELIAEAREYADAIQGGENENWMRLVACVDETADALEAAERKYSELLVAGEPQRRANRRLNATQTDALKADAWDEGARALRDIYGDTVEDNPYRVQP